MPFKIKQHWDEQGRLNRSTARGVAAVTPVNSTIPEEICNIETEDAGSLGSSKYLSNNKIVTSERFDFTALFKDTPFLIRDRKNKPRGRNDDQDDDDLHGFHTTGVWAVLSRQAFFVVQCMLWGFLAMSVYRSVALVINLRDLNASAAADTNGIEIKSETLAFAVHSDIKWLCMDISMVLSALLLLTALTRSRKQYFRSRSHSLAQTEKICILGLFLAAVSCGCLTHLGMSADYLLEFEENSPYVLFVCRCFYISVSKTRMPLMSQMHINALLSSAMTSKDPATTFAHPLTLPESSYLLTKPVEAYRNQDSQVVDGFRTSIQTIAMLDMVGIGFRIAIFMAICAFLPPLLVPKWKDSLLLYLGMLFVYLVIAIMPFARFPLMPVANALVLTICGGFIFMLGILVSSTGLISSALLFEQAQAQQKKQNELFRWSFHEVRVPCTAIVIGIDSLRQLKDLTEGTRETVEDVGYAARQLKILLDNVLEWQRTSEIGMKLAETQFQPMQLLQESCSTFRSSAMSQGLDLVLEIPKTVENMQTVVTADNQKLSHVILNLLSNAIKFARSEIIVRYLVSPICSMRDVLHQSLPTHGPIAEFQALDKQAVEDLLRSRDNCTSNPHSHAAETLFEKPTDAHSKNHAKGIFIVQVLDDGIGMDSQQLKSYEKEFNHPKEGLASIRNAGTGLGAHISGKMIQSMEGKLFVRSSHEVGTVITVAIPVRVEQQSKGELDHAWQAVLSNYFHSFLCGFGSCGTKSHSPFLPDGSAIGHLFTRVRSNVTNPMPHAKHSQSVLKGMRILVVEDDRIVAKVLSRAIKSCGASVEVAIHGAQGLCILASTFHVSKDKLENDLTLAKQEETSSASVPGKQTTQSWAAEMVQQYLSKQTPPFDLVLMDMNMPELNGMSTAKVLNTWRAAADAHSKLPVVIGVTGNALDEDLSAFMASGVNAAIPKPVSISDLEACIQKLANLFG